MRTWYGPSVAFGLVLALAGRSWADDQAEINALIDKAVKAMGGQEKMAKLKASSWKGKANLQEGGQAIAITHEGSTQGWDQFRLEGEVQFGGQSHKALLVINGDKGWAKHEDKVEDASKDALVMMKDSFYAMRVCQLLRALKDKAFQTSHLGELKIGERQVIGIQLVHKDHKDLNLFFDKANGLPVKSEIRLTEPGGGKEITVEYHFSDYKDFDGLKHFTKITFKFDNKEFVTELSEIQAQEKLDDSVFAKP